MTREYKKAVSDFLSQYVEPHNSSNIVDGAYSDRLIKQSIGILINQGIFEATEMQKELMRYHSVLVPIDFILDCTK